LNRGRQRPTNEGATGEERLSYDRGFSFSLNGLVGSSFFPLFKRLLDFLAAM
jgi:hypothetical protein